MCQGSRHQLITATLSVRFFLTMFFISSVAMAEPSLTLSQLDNAITPNDFKSMVKSLGDKNRQALTQQFQDEISKQLSSSSTQNKTTTSAPVPPVNGAETSVTQPPAATAPTPTFYTSPPGASPPSSSNFSTQASSPTTQPNQGIYTGFGGGTGTNTETGTSPPPAASSGGWNVKY